MDYDDQEEDDSVGGQAHLPPPADALELIWGRGWLYSGGPAAVDDLVQGLDLRGRQLLDIECGGSGVDIYLIEKHQAGHVTGLGSDSQVLEAAQQEADARGLRDRVRFRTWSGTSLPFDDQQFDMVLSNGGLAASADKKAITDEIFRVLKPGGVLSASEDMIHHEGDTSPEIADFLGLKRGEQVFASQEEYRGALRDAGFIDVVLSDRSMTATETVRMELTSTEGPIRREAIQAFGEASFQRAVERWKKRLALIQNGKLQPTHLRARRPDAGEGL